VRRSGYSLFEVALVMTLLVLAGILALPFIQPMLAGNNLQAASDMLRARWTEMRSRALADGRPYRFAIKDNTGNFKIAPDGEEFWGDAGTGGSNAAPMSDIPPWVIQEQLPGQVLFLKAGTIGTGSDPSVGGSSSGGWTTVFVFLPNGTAHEDVQVTFGMAGSRSLALKLRGATGTILSEAGGEGNQR
jgi:type II secretory pathway pseudopilin PulG